MAPVTVLILAPEPALDAGPLERTMDAARASLAEHHRRGFLEAGADAVVVRREPPDHTPFGARLRRLVGELRPDGLIVLGAGSIPLATGADLVRFVEAAAADVPGALANHRYSADVVAIARAGLVLRDVPDLASDNALPRWLEEAAAIRVHDLATRRRLAMDVDSPLDLELIAGARGAPPLPRARSGRLAKPSAPAWRRCACWRPTRAPSSSWPAGPRPPTSAGWSAARDRAPGPSWRSAGSGRPGRAPSWAGPNRRPPRSVLGELLERDGPGSLGRHVAALADGALLDSRVLLAHRLGADERAWPPPEDRYASDLLLPSRITRPVAARAHGGGARRPDPGPARRPHARRARRPPGAPALTTRRPPAPRTIDPMDDDHGAFQPALVRTPFPDPESVGEDDVLVERLRAEIRREGPITFARFMERALYEPGHGYYRRAEPGPGRAGDFLTAPEAHPIFGAAIGRLLEEAWDALGRPSPFVVREHGAGTGALAAGLLAGLRDVGSPLLDAIRYRPVEVEAARVEAFRARLAALETGAR